MYLVSNCPVGKLAYPFGSQWAFPILVEIHSGVHSFTDLKRALNPITNKMLSRVLQKMVSECCVEKCNFKYKITDKGLRVLQSLSILAEDSAVCDSCSGKVICSLRELKT